MHFSVLTGREKPLTMNHVYFVISIVDIGKGGEEYKQKKLVKMRTSVMTNLIKSYQRTLLFKDKV